MCVPGGGIVFLLTGALFGYGAEMDLTETW